MLTKVFKYTFIVFSFYPLTPRRTHVSPFTEISILFWEGNIKKISNERRAYESLDEKKPILGYVPKNDEKNLVHKGLKKWKFPNYINPLTPRRTQVSPFTEISILF